MCEAHTGWRFRVFRVPSPEEEAGMTYIVTAKWNRKTVLYAVSKVEADGFEITPNGTLVFYRMKTPSDASGQPERIALRAFSSEQWIQVLDYEEWRRLYDPPKNVPV
jgi:hypothetical protein